MFCQVKKSIRGCLHYSQLVYRNRYGYDRSIHRMVSTSSRWTVGNYNFLQPHSRVYASKELKQQHLKGNKVLSFSTVTGYIPSNVSFIQHSLGAKLHMIGVQRGKESVTEVQTVIREVRPSILVVGEHSSIDSEAHCDAYQCAIEESLDLGCHIEYAGVQFKPTVVDVFKTLAFVHPYVYELFLDPNLQEGWKKVFRGEALTRKDIKPQLTVLKKYMPNTYARFEQTSTKIFSEFQQHFHSSETIVLVLDLKYLDIVEEMVMKDHEFCKSEKMNEPKEQIQRG